MYGDEQYPTNKAIQNRNCSKYYMIGRKQQNAAQICVGWQKKASRKQIETKQLSLRGKKNPANLQQGQDKEVGW